MQSEPRNARISVWALSISLAATLEIDVSFSSSGYLDVSVHRVPSVHLWIQCTVTEVCSAGFPHSEICGSMDICSSPQLIAAYHVFHRLLVPRHPPCALYSLTCRIVFAILLMLHRIALRVTPVCYKKLVLFLISFDISLGCLFNIFLSRFARIFRFVQTLIFDT